MRGYTKILAWPIAVAALSPAYAQAQSIPDAADVGRIKPAIEQNTYNTPQERPTTTEGKATITVPEGAESITFTLQQLEVAGATILGDKIAKTLAPHLAKEVSLSDVYQIAAEITSLYRNEGYFLSRAYIPAQEIENGNVVIQVIEGSIDRVSLNGETPESDIWKNLIAQLTEKTPLKASKLESILLRLNDIPGVSLFGVINKIKDKGKEAIELSLQKTEEKGTGRIVLDNFGSRFLGPYQALASYKDSFLPFQNTELVSLGDVTLEEMKYLGFTHEVMLTPEIKLEFFGNYVTATPGSRLERNDIESDSIGAGIGVSWSAIRQWEENLEVSLRLDGKNTDSDILGNTPLTRDRIRAIRGEVSYDITDGWNGKNYLNFTASKGVGVFGASDKGDANLSRAQADPEFSSMLLSYTRHQNITHDWLLLGKLSGQWASSPLFSSEEFGYGGQHFGRAFDPSELTGDEGIAASGEVRYLGLDSWYDVNLIPYGFYDIGKVWNKDTGGMSASAASAGLGTHWHHISGVSGNVGVAWPLTKEAATPIYGDGKKPRILFQLGYGF